MRYQTLDRDDDEADDGDYNNAMMTNIRTVMIVASCGYDGDDDDDQVINHVNNDDDNVDNNGDDDDSENDNNMAITVKIMLVMIMVMMVMTMMIKLLMTRMLMMMMMMMIMLMMMQDKKGWYTTLNPSLAKELWIPDIFIGTQLIFSKQF